MAVKEGVSGVNPVIKCRSLGGERRTIKVLSPEEIRLLLNTARGIAGRKGKHFTQIYHIVLLALASGMRRGELLALKWDCIDTENATITIKESLSHVKGGLHTDNPKSNASRRTIKIDRQVLDTLEVLKMPNCNLVFHTRKGTELSPINVGTSYRKLLDDANLEGFRFHDLRHTHATQLIASGVNIKQVSARLGHKNISITLDLYAHAQPALDQKAAEIMGSFLFV